MPEIKIEDVLARVSALEQRLDAFESSAPETEMKIKSHAELMRIELKDIEENPDDHVERRVGFGAKRDDATKAVEARKAFIRSELGIKPVAKVVKAVKKGGTAALVILALLIAFAFTASAADTQGYPFSLYSPTNLPVWPVATLTNGTAVLYSLNSPATNYVPLRSKSGLAVQSIFAGTTNTLAGSEVLYFYPSVDSTNAINPNAPWSTLSIPANSAGGAYASIGGTNWSELTLRGYAGLFYTVSNACNGLIITGGTITNVQNGVTNYYPAGLLFNRPN